MPVMTSVPFSPNGSGVVSVAIYYDNQNTVEE
jgi:hypothetical protein